MMNKEKNIYNIYKIKYKKYKEKYKNIYKYNQAQSNNSND